MSSAANEKWLTWKRSLDGCEDVGLREGVTVGEAICKLADLEEKDIVEVVHGRWIKDGDVVVCSNCGEEHAWEEYRATYCEDCGAKMDGGNDNG